MPELCSITLEVTAQNAHRGFRYNMRVTFFMQRLYVLQNIVLRCENICRLHCVLRDIMKRLNVLRNNVLRYENSFRL